MQKEVKIKFGVEFVCLQAVFSTKNKAVCEIKKALICEDSKIDPHS